MAVHAAGRVPEIDDLNLDVAGVAWTTAGVSVNEYLQSVSNPSVYAAGDAVDSGGFPPTPLPLMHGGGVGPRPLEGNHPTPYNPRLPMVGFTPPPLSLGG